MASESEQERRETLADIVREKRELADALESATARDWNSDQQEAINDLRDDADRIEAAAKRERDEIEAACRSVLSDAFMSGEIGVAPTAEESSAVGNTAAMREALEAALSFVGNLEIEPYSPLDEAASELRQRIMDALAAPARQCDVGTAEEQEERYLKLKREHVDRLARCPAVGQSFFFPDSLYWAQTPYAEEGAGK